jgi:hypothetical protein
MWFALSSPAYAHGMGAVAYLAMFVIGTPIYIGACLLLAWITAWSLRTLLAKRRKKPSLGTLTLLAALVLLPVGPVTYWMGESMGRASSARHAARLGAIDRALCGSDSPTFGKVVPPLVGSAGHILQIARACIVDRGNTAAFRALISVLADAHGWRGQAAPSGEGDSKFCDWVNLSAGRREFVTVFRAEKLPLVCSRVKPYEINVPGLGIVRTTWFGSEAYVEAAWFKTFASNLLPPETHGEWMAFLMTQGIDPNIRSGLGLESQRVPDYAASNGLTVLYAKLMELGIQPTRDFGPHLSTSQHFESRRAQQMETQRRRYLTVPQALELEALIPPMTAAERDGGQRGVHQSQHRKSAPRGFGQIANLRQRQGLEGIDGHYLALLNHLPKLAFVHQARAGEASQLSYQFGQTPALPKKAIDRGCKALGLRNPRRPARWVLCVVADEAAQCGGVEGVTLVRHEAVQGTEERAFLGDEKVSARQAEQEQHGEQRSGV